MIKEQVPDSVHSRSFTNVLFVPLGEAPAGKNEIFIMHLPKFLWTSSMKPLISFFLVLTLLVDLSVAFGREEPAGNLTFQSFNKAKKALVPCNNNIFA